MQRDAALLSGKIERLTTSDGACICSDAGPVAIRAKYVLLSLEVHGEVALAGIGQHGHDGLAGALGAGGDVERGKGGGTA